MRAFACALHTYARRLSKLIPSLGSTVFALAISAFAPNLFAAEAHAPVSVGSEQACAALGGTWGKDKDMSESWRRECAVPWDQARCNAAQGTLRPTSMECVLRPSPADLANFCRAAGGVWGLHGGRAEHCFFRSEKETCIASGGTWQRAGWEQKSRCVRPTRDAGKSCTDSSQCEIACLAEKKPSEDASDLKGQCAATDNPFANCGTRIEKGRAVRTLCAD
jgi:hypothetical protein